MHKLTSTGAILSDSVVVVVVRTKAPASHLPRADEDDHAKFYRYGAPHGGLRPPVLSYKIKVNFFGLAVF